MRYAYGVTALLLLSGSAFALSTGNPGPVTATGPVAIAQSGLAPRGAPNSFADLAAQLQPAVVNIATKQKVQVATSFNPFTGERRPVTQEQQSGGSGFFISADGLIVTNNHVIAGGPKGDAVDEVNGYTYIMSNFQHPGDMTFVPAVETAVRPLINQNFKDGYSAAVGYLAFKA